MFQAIETKYIPATNFKPARIKAICAAKSLTIGYHSIDDTGKMNENDLHFAVAKKLADSLDWIGETEKLIGGVLKNGNRVFVITR